MAELSLSIEQLSQATAVTKAQQEVLSLQFARLIGEEVAKAMKKKPEAIKALQHAAIVSSAKC
jgi:hypothetical protein